MIDNQPAQWDMEADLVAIGSGGGGLCAAITAADHGLSAIVLEKSDELGGVTAYSMGEIWIPGNHLELAEGIEDSAESGLRYVKGLAMGYGEEALMLNQAVHGPVALKYFEDTIGLKMMLIRNFADYYYPHHSDATSEGRYLEVEPFPAETLGAWQHKVRLSPHMPSGFTHADIFGGGGLANMLGWDYSILAQRIEADERCTGPGLAAYYVKGALDKGVDLQTGIGAEELIGNGQRIMGVRAVRDSKSVFVKANKGVVIAVSSFERNRKLNKDLSLLIDAGSMVMGSVDGAALRLAGPVGARIGRVPDPPGLGIDFPGEEHDNGSQLTRGAIPFMGLPHSVVVNRQGKRFCNEAFYRSLYFAIEHIDGATQTTPNLPCWIIMDGQNRAKYPFGSVMPGQDMPEGLGAKADSLAELAGLIGVDAAGLVATVEAFNAQADAGQDPDFGRGTFPWGANMTGDLSHRPNPNLGALREGPYYAVELKPMGGGGITGTGLVADHHCRVLGWDDAPIAGLYAAGGSVVRFDTGAVMQSGMSNARGMTHGFLAGLHAAGQPSDLLEKALAGR
jgi:3-oxosteroid 1-dehydrogenase